MRYRSLFCYGQALLCLAALGLAACGGSSSTAVTSTSALNSFELSADLSSDTLPLAVANSPYAYAFETNAGQAGVNGILPVSFSATGIPPGMSMSSEGVLSGTPTAAGGYLIDVTAVDSSPQPQTVSGGYTMQVRLPGADLTQVAHNNLGAHGQNAYVSVAVASATQVPYAYVGTRGSPGDCPATGVKIVNLSQISNPQLVTTVGAVAGAQQERARIATGITSPDFHAGSTGDLLAVTEEPCNTADASATEEGVQFYDDTNPLNPVPLGTWTSGVDGVDDVAILPESNGNIYALVAVPNSETQQVSNPEGDLRILNITNPAVPTEIGNWGIIKATGIPVALMYLGQDQQVFLSSISVTSDLSTAYLSYWDGGVVVLNVSDPTVVTSTNQSIFVNQITYPTIVAATATTPSAPEGNTHEALPIENANELLITDFVCASGTPTNPYLASFCGPLNDIPLGPNYGWGYFRTYNLPTPQTSTLGGFYDTAESVSAPAPDDGIYTADDLAWNGSSTDPHAYVGWLSSGLVDLDVSTIASPELLADFIPPATPDPNGDIAGVDNPPTPLVEGVASYTVNGQPYVLVSDVNSGLWIVSETPTPNLTILTTSLPAGNVGVPYDAKLSAVNGADGNSAITYAVSPNSVNPLPSGLELLDTAGNIGGTPTASGTTPVTFEATDGLGNITTQVVTFTINQVLAIIPPSVGESDGISQPYVPTPTVGEPFSITLTAVNGVAPYTFSLVGGTLPTGLILTPSNGVISGTPFSTGTTTFTVQVTDSSNPHLTATLPITVDVTPLEVASGSLTLTDGYLGATYADTVTMATGTYPFTPSLLSGTLPPGLALSGGGNTAGWMISGTPTVTGTYNFDVQITDSYQQSVTQAFTLVVNPFAITPQVLPSGRASAGYNVSLNAQGGTSPYTYGLELGPLPSGITLTQAGVLSGVPASGTQGVYPIEIQAIDANGLVTNQNFNLDIFSGNSLAITTPGLVPEQAGQSYSQNVVADYGSPPYTYSLESGTLPAGMTFSTEGQLSGVSGAAAVGSYTFTIQATDAVGDTTTQTFTLTVLPATSPTG